MSKQEIAQIKLVFAAFDGDGDGALSYPQANDAFFSLGVDAAVKFSA